MSSEAFFFAWLAVETAQQAGQLSRPEAQQLQCQVAARMIELGLTPADVLPADVHSLFRSARTRTP